MTTLPLPDHLARALALSADRLAADMISSRGLDATLGERVEIERFVAGLVAWGSALAAEPTVVDDEREGVLTAAALRALAGWDGRLAETAAAWQLALAARDLDEHPPVTPRRRAANG